MCKDDQHRGFGNRSRPVRWPPRSPDLAPLDLLWGEMKRLVYETLLDTEEELVTRVAIAAVVIFQTPGIFERTRQSPVCRCYLCVEVNGEQFQQLQVKHGNFV
mgnify:CR=1 FL=1